MSSRVETLFKLNGSEQIVLATARKLGYTSSQIELLKIPYDELPGDEKIKKPFYKGLKSELFCIAAVCSLGCVDSFRWGTEQEDANDIDFWTVFNSQLGFPNIPVQVKTTSDAASKFRQYNDYKGKVVVLNAIPAIRDGYPLPDPLEDVQANFIKQLKNFKQINMELVSDLLTIW